MVTGGAGFVGSHVCESFVDLSYDVLVVDNLSTGESSNIPSSCDFIQGDIAEKGFLEKVVFDFEPELVIHLAAQSSVTRSVIDPSLDSKVNVIGTLLLLESLKNLKHKVSLIYSSTGGAAYGSPTEIPVDESCEVEPISQYGASKLAAEYYISLYSRLYNFSTVNFRLGNVYGPRQRSDLESGVISIFTEKINNQEPLVLFGHGKASRDYIYVSDVVEAFKIASELEFKGEIFNLGTGIDTKVEEVMDCLVKCLGKEPYGVEKLPLRPGELNSISLSSKSFYEKTGWKPIFSLQDGIALFVDSILKR
tara:strand:+ start:206 stop:1126 length:921 start_codon:yes stop_codon:yes gene_type:complete